MRCRARRRWAALGLVIPVWLVGGCGCAGSPTMARDAGADREPATSCGVPLPSWPARLTHTAEVISRQVLLHQEDTCHPVCMNDVYAAFVDDQDLLVFESQHMLRATLDGRLLSATPLPLAPDGSTLGSGVTRGGSTFAAVSVSGSLCIIAADGTMDSATCSNVKPGLLPYMAWGGAVYVAYSLRDWRTNTMRLATYDEHGHVTGEHLLPGPAPNMSYGLPIPSRDTMVIAYAANRSGCDALFMDVLPRSLDPTARTITEVTPARFCSRGGFVGYTATSPNRIAWLEEVQCNPDPPNGLSQPTFTWLTMLRRDGTLVAGASHPIPGQSWLGTLWDGERFLAMGYDRSSAASTHKFFVHTFDEDGNLQAQAVPVPFEQDPRDGDSKGVITAVGPNDYVAILNVPAGFNSFVRFRLKPR